MCDVGKGVTRMLTPSQRQIDFVSAAAPIVGSVTGMEAAKAMAAAGMGQQQYAGQAGMQSGYAGGGGGLTSAQMAAMAAAQQRARGGGMSTETKWSIGVGAGVLAIGAAILLWPK